MSGLTVDQDMCNQDGICAAVCPRHLIEMTPEEYPAAGPDFAELCLKCGHCVAVCPQAALSLDWLQPEDCLDLRPELSLNQEQAAQFLRSRRSIRIYQDKPVERAKLEELLATAVHAASASNGQPWHWLVIQDRAEVKRMAGLVIDWMRQTIDQDPDLAQAFSMASLVSAWDSGQDRISRDAPNLILVHGDEGLFFGPEDCALALSYVELLAPTLGLGACWVAYLYYPSNLYPPLTKALGLPKGHRFYGAVLVGYPKFKYQRSPNRNPARVTWK